MTESILDPEFRTKLRICHYYILIANQALLRRYYLYTCVYWSKLHLLHSNTCNSKMFVSSCLYSNYAEIGNCNFFCTIFTQTTIPSLCRKSNKELFEVSCWRTNIFSQGFCLIVAIIIITIIHTGLKVAVIFARKCLTLNTRQNKHFQSKSK